MKQYYSVHPEHLKSMDTAQLRENFLIETVFQKDEVVLSYSQDDRFIVGGIQPVSKVLELVINKEIGVDYFFERREAGVTT